MGCQIGIAFDIDAIRIYQVQNSRHFFLVWIIFIIKFGTSSTYDGAGERLPSRKMWPQYLILVVYMCQNKPSDDI